jgi:hypothetical protein
MRTTTWTPSSAYAELGKAGKADGVIDCAAEDGDCAVGSTVEASRVSERAMEAVVAARSSSRLPGSLSSY